MISLLFGIFFSCLSAFSSDVSLVDVKVGVSQAIPIQSKMFKTPKYNFIFSSDDYNFRLAYKLITKEVFVALLPPEYALKAIWASDNLDIVGKTFQHDVYLVSPDKNKVISKESIKDKNIFLLENSADEFYLKKYLGNIQFQKKSMTALEMMKLVEKRDGVGFILMDSMNYLKLKKKDNKINALRIDGGVYYIVMLEASNLIMLDSESKNAFKKNKIPYSEITKNDLRELKDLNNFIVKKRLGQENFEALYSMLMLRD